MFSLMPNFCRRAFIAANVAHEWHRYKRSDQIPAVHRDINWRYWVSANQMNFGMVACSASSIVSLTSFSLSAL